MKYWLITGEQIDGEHEYRIVSVRQFENEPTPYDCNKALIEDHAFGLEENEDFDPMDAFFNYGDGMTLIRYCGFREASEAEVKIIREVC